MDQGRRHVDVFGVDGFDALLAVLLPKALWRRILALRIMRGLELVPKSSSVFSLLMVPAVMTFTDDFQTGVFSWTPKRLPAGELTFRYRGQTWEVLDVSGKLRPISQLDGPVFISARQ